MFATMIRAYAQSVALCALVIVCVTPNLIHAQESDGAVIHASTTENVLASTTDVISDTPPSLLELYPTEGVPGGGDAIGDFVVGPGKIDISIKPGETKIVEMTVTNRTGERRRFNITMEDAMGSNDPRSSVVLLGSEVGPYSMKDYASVPYRSFEIDHNQRARIPVTISVPLNADPGGLYGSVLVDTVAVDAKAGDGSGTVPQSAIIARIGTLFFITVPGSVEKEGSLKKFGTVSEKSFFQASPINFGILFENKGSIHLAPYGELRVTNVFGEEVGFVELEPWFVLPQSVRLREVSWSREFLFGRYTATVFINRSYDDTVDEMSFSFWVLPWKILGAGFAGLFIVLFALRVFFRSFEFKRKR